MKFNYKSLFILTFLLLVSFNLPTKAQITLSEDGLYYDQSDELFSGLYVEKYDDGTVKIQVAIQNGRKNGLMKIYYPDGSVNELRMYKNNMMHGTWETWNAAGIKTAEANYANDKKNGKWYIWDDSGTMRYDMIYFEGNKAGTWRMMNEKGELISTREFPLEAVNGKQ
ncbi:MAG: hypothetical protein JXR41_06745 [Bacteroidales bacterium]|nr:hypothetical protein [Bacteroidales bacterium]MBN2762769.1 hypothetical protein [Bacteroidales bacterium]